MPATDYEKLGAFYLGRIYDLAARARTDSLLLYDSKDLVTHAVCVGMTGSGKTGLCLGLIEEAAIDGIPSIIIDPKGDLPNLLLTFPELRPADFVPWINEDDARKKGLTPEQHATAQAELWRKGLAEWDQSGDRIRKLKDAADFAVYTPGSAAGLPVSVLRSFDAPPAAIMEDAELLRDRIGGTATSLLGLMGITAEPLQSREHILLCNIFAHAWGLGQNLDIPTLIHHIQQPPFSRLGVMELESVYPARDRFSLAMALNNLVAAPGFSAWMEGQPLDIGSFLYTPSGKPRVAIFSIAHLDDAQRMFFVSLLLNQVLGWVRTQSGTTSLRALLYMDEIAGYFPPVANPPSKAPLLTLMKQSRAFGVGIVLATQNPVDIDYKGLSNAGTWFIGRLQTERDKARVLDGLEGAAAGASARFDRAACDRALSALGSRVFLMNNVHDDHPEIFETRWCLSYLRGPLTRQQIKSLMDPVRTGLPAPGPAVGTPQPQATKAPGAPAASGGARPVLPPEVPQYFVPARNSGTVCYAPNLLGLGKVYYKEAKADIEHECAVAYLVPIRDGAVAVDWDHAEESDLTESDLEAAPAPGSAFAALPPDASKPKSFDAWKKAFADAVFRRHTLELYSCGAYKLTSTPGENERDFRARVAQAAREERDAAAEKLRAKYAPKLATLQDRIRRAEQVVDVQKQQASSAKVSTALSFGAAILGAFLGRKVASAGNVGRAASAARGVGRQSKEAADVGRAEENVAALRAQLAELEEQFRADVDADAGRADAAAQTVERVTLRPKKTGISVRAVVLAWTPAD
ncbi:MAG: ATP-binding protein [Phycisphaerae bacterium]|nr:ATP-binding protein [Phycisphaerae bacterium]